MTLQDRANCQSRRGESRQKHARYITRYRKCADTSTDDDSDAGDAGHGFSLLPMQEEEETQPLLAHFNSTVDT